LQKISDQWELIINKTIRFTESRWRGLII
jgi:hypothetical protein